MGNVFVKQIGIYLFPCENIQITATAILMVILEIFKDIF